MPTDTTLSKTLKLDLYETSRSSPNRFGPSHHSGRQRPSHQLRVGCDIVSVLFFSVMRFDPHNPRSETSDVFVLSKGHAAPLLYAAWAEAGALPTREAANASKAGFRPGRASNSTSPIRRCSYRITWPGTSAGVGMAVGAKKLWHSDQRVYVLNWRRRVGRGIQLGSGAMGGLPPTG